MATKQYYATGSFKYGTRMMKAGDPVDLDGPSARLFNALGKITTRKPRAVPVQELADALPPQIVKRAPRKRKVKK